MFKNILRYENQYCPEPLLFSTETNRCESPADVNREGCETDFCPDGIYPIPEDCSGFFLCSNGIQWENQYCPDELLFNPAEGVCDWPNNVNCGVEPPTSPRPPHDFCYVKCLIGKGKVSDCLEKCFNIEVPKPTQVKVEKCYEESFK